MVKKIRTELITDEDEGPHREVYSGLAARPAPFAARLTGLSNALRFGTGISTGLPCFGRSSA